MGSGTQTGLVLALTGTGWVSRPRAKPVTHRRISLYATPFSSFQYSWDYRRLTNGATFRYRARTSATDFQPSQPKLISLHAWPVRLWLGRAARTGVCFRGSSAR